MAPNGNKKIIGPWIAAAVMAVIFLAVLATVALNVASGWSTLAQYAQTLEGYNYYPSFVDPEDLLYI